MKDIGQMETIVLFVNNFFSGVLHVQVILVVALVMYLKNLFLVEGNAYVKLDIFWKIICVATIAVKAVNQKIYVILVMLLIKEHYNLKNVYVIINFLIMD